MPEPSRQPLLSGIVVHWGDPAPLGSLADAWPDDPRFELVVVDNGPPGRQGHPAWEAVRRRGRVVSAGRNLGFAGGANAGAREARGDLLLILNPDARPEPGALEALLEGFAAHPEAAGLAPRLVGEDGAPQFAWQLRDLPSLGELLLHALGIGGGPAARREPAAGTAIEQPAAAALALRRPVFEAAGGFDPALHPAWFEDVDLAARLAAAHRRGAAGPLVYWPAARFRHGLGGTVDQLGYGRFLWTYQRNLVRYLAKHHGRGATALARLLLPAGHLLRLALLPLRKPRRAATRAAAATGLLSALAGALTGWRRPDSWAREAAAPGDGTTPTPQNRGVDADQRTLASEPFPADPAGDPPAVAVCIVTRDSRADLAGCFAAVAALEHRPLTAVVVDCASGDGTPAEAERLSRVLEDAGVPLTLLPLDENRGFAGGMNTAIAAAVEEAPNTAWILSLNADARPAPDYIDRLLARAAAHPGLAVGALTGRLVRPARNDGAPPDPAETDPAGAAGSEDRSAVLDACGMRLTRTWRHLDRGSGEPDRGQYAVAERVFGATGAASLFRRAALDDAALPPLEENPEPSRLYFDPLFHSFREDAELAFRLRERGWEVVYEPAARAEHRRFNLPERRAAMPAAVNRHSLKNRYLLRLYHQTPGNLAKTLAPTLARDLLALGYVVLRERSSLPAYAWLWRHRGALWARRRALQARRRRPAAALDRWFGASALPLETSTEDGP